MFVDLAFDVKGWLALASSLVAMGVFVNYVRTILKGETKPHAYTWLIWGITQGTAVAGMWYGDGGWGAVALTLSTIAVFSVFGLSLFYGTRNITKSDTIILLLALSAILVWWQLENPVLAILMVTTIDVFGYIPSWRKTKISPWSESLLSWSISPLGHVLAILAFAEYNFFTLTYPIVLVICNLILVGIGLYYRSKGNRPSRKR